MQKRWIVVTVLAGLVVAGSVSAGPAAVPGGNLVKNPGGDAGPSQTNIANVGAPKFIPPSWEWTTVPEKDAGFVAARYGSHPYFPSKAVGAAIGGGKNFLWAGYPLQRSTATQTIDVAGAASEIDGGGVKVCLSAYLGSLRKNPDSSIQLDLELLGAEGARLAELRLQPVKGKTLAETTLLRRAAERVVPRGTRQLRVVLTGQRPVSGGAIYGYADNVSVGLTTGVCDPVLAVRCTGGALVATVTPGGVARTQRVRFAVQGAKGSKQANDGRAPYSARFTMAGLTGRLTVTATVNQTGTGPLTLTKKSGRC